MLIDQKHWFVVPYSNGGRTLGVYRANAIIRSEVTEDGGSVTTTSRTSQAVGALVGNAIFGPAGFIVGGLSGKTRSKSAVSKVGFALTVNDPNRPLWTIELLDLSKPAERSSGPAAGALKLANEVHALMSVFIRKADETQQANAGAVQTPTALPRQTTAPSHPERLAFSEEFTKLAKLKQAGMLSDLEFTEMKAALIQTAKKRASQE
jgi:hypothetical protein